MKTPEYLDRVIEFVKNDLEETAEMRQKELLTVKSKPKDKPTPAEIKKEKARIKREKKNA